MKFIYYKPFPQAIEYIKEWEKDNNIEVEVSSNKFDYKEIEKLSAYDGLVLTTIKELEEDMYQKIADQDIKQIALTSVGFDKIDLDKANESGGIGW